MRETLVVGYVIDDDEVAVESVFFDLILLATLYVFITSLNSHTLYTLIL